MKEVSLKDLLEAGAHFGHQTTRWNPKMRTFIYTSRDGIHIFDLVKTKEGLEDATAYAKSAVKDGGLILFIGTKRQAQDIIKDAAKKASMPYMTRRWVGGLLTNWDRIKKRLEYLADLKSGKIDGRFKDRTKKENLLIDREIIKMEQSFGGIADLREIPAAVFVADARKDLAALKEARACGVKTIAIVDTNADPEFVDFPIPANDDATKSIQLIVDALLEAIEEGKKHTEGGKSKAEVGSEEKEPKKKTVKVKKVKKTTKEAK